MASAETLRKQIATLGLAMTDFDAVTVQSALIDFMATDATINLCYPFGEMIGPQALYDTAYAPLLSALPDLERRGWIVSAGTDEDGRRLDRLRGPLHGHFCQPLS